MKALVGAFNQEKALVGAFSVIVQLHRLIDLRHYLRVLGAAPLRAQVQANSGYGLASNSSLNSFDIQFLINVVREFGICKR